MAGEALVIGIVITLLGVAVAVVVAVLVFARRRASNDPPGGKTVPPPVDPGPTHPEQARDVNAD